jgi:thiol-disulfide isomerase/thioredoxin
MPRAVWWCTLLCLLASPWSDPAAVASRTLSLTDGTEVDAEVYAAAGSVLVLWLPSEAGVQAAETSAAAELAAAGMEIWIVDVLAARFLPQAQSSMDAVPADDVAALVEAAARTGKRVFLVSADRGAVPVLRGGRRWQESHPASAALGGVVLMHPKLYVETPDPGVPPRLLPVVEASNLPIFLLQPALSPWRWRLDETVPALRRGGSEVFVQLLAGVRDRFFFRPDADAAEQRLGTGLSRLIRRAVSLLAALPSTPRRAVAVTAPRTEVAEGKKPRELQPYRGNPRPPALGLVDLGGRRWDSSALGRRVVLVNFWASWCPPCVHEMPSMQRLQDALHGEPFTILAVNMAESPATVERFLGGAVTVDFPVLLDADGAALKRWGVFAFPTSYVLGKQGHIRYALFGAVDWDDPTIVAKLRDLLAE